MNEMIKFLDIENRIITIQNQQTLIDRDVAELYGVETKRVNEAVKNNPDKFTDGYVVTLSSEDKSELVENFDRFSPQIQSILAETREHMARRNLLPLEKSEKL